MLLTIGALLAISNNDRKIRYQSTHKLKSNLKLKRNGKVPLPGIYMHEEIKELETILDHPVFSVGGCVRDSVLELKPHDIDFTSSLQSL